ncbi:MAG: M23 family metallopeptidase [Bacillota bacterium]
MLKNRKITILVFVLLFAVLCLPAGATEYKPLEIDLPAADINEPGTTSYIVQKGDTLYSIGRMFSSEAGLIAAVNDIKNPDMIKPGQKILVPRIYEVSHQVTAGETVRDIAALYGILPQQILFANDVWFPNRLKAGTVLAIPGIKASVTITSNRATTVSARNHTFFMNTPAKGVLTSVFGKRGSEFHTGIDIANDLGTPIKAAQAGKVVFVGRNGNYGRTVIIDHQNGYRTLYGHNSRIMVNMNQWVQAQETIALMGNTGRSTGPHLHFEIYESGKVVNPLKYIYSSSFAPTNDY